MDKIAREQFQSRLENDWRCYVERFRLLSQTDQEAFLKKQGYARLGDLLSHVIAWWQDGIENIEHMIADPALPLKEYDVDAFNARAVARFCPCSEDEIVRAFQTERQAMLDLVSNLPEDRLNQENINTRLYYEILMHWKEHEIIPHP